MVCDATLLQIDIPWYMRLHGSGIGWVDVMPGSYEIRESWFSGRIASPCAILMDMRNLKSNVAWDSLSGRRYSYAVLLYLY
jgi:hypothetical protein